MGSVLVPKRPATILSADAIHVRRERIEELWEAGEIEALTYFGMLFFHGIESGGKARTALPAARHAYDDLKSTLSARTMTRGHAYEFGLGTGVTQPTFDEGAWVERELGVDARGLGGFAALVRSSAQDAASKAGVDLLGSLAPSFLGFVRLDLSVRVAPDGSGLPTGALESLGGEPDSAHYFSFAELAFWALDRDPEREFWLTLARATVAAQPTFLCNYFMAARRAPRTSQDYGPQDVLLDPMELAKRLRLAPPVEDLASAGTDELQLLAGRNAHAGLIGTSRQLRKSS